MALEHGSGPMTFAEYCELPEGLYTLIDGELIVSPSPAPWHQRIQARIHYALETYVRSHKVGRVYDAPLDVVLRQESPPVVVQPDLFFIARGSKVNVTDRWIDGPPELVIEVLSPGNPRLDTVRKRAIYERFGVKEYWIVFPDMEQIQVLRHTGTGFARPELLENEDVLETALLPGFRLPLPELFAPEED
jgi:Uma2 family endonuclease